MFFKLRLFSCIDILNVLKCTCVVRMISCNETALHIERNIHTLHINEIILAVPAIVEGNERSLLQNEHL